MIFLLCISATINDTLVISIELFFNDIRLLIITGFLLSIIAYDVRGIETIAHGETLTLQLINAISIKPVSDTVVFL